MSVESLAGDPIVRGALGWSLAVLFASAAWHKGRDLHVFAAVLWNYELLPLSAIKPVALLLVVVESALAVSFLVPSPVPMAGYAAAALMLIYGFAIAVNLARGRTDMSCGCEGGEREQPLRAGLLVRNAILAAAALVATGSLAPGGGSAGGAVVREMVWLDWFAAAAAAATIVALWSAAGQLRALERDGAPRWRAA